MKDEAPDDRRGRLGCEHFAQPLIRQGLTQPFYMLRTAWLGVLAEIPYLTNSLLHMRTRGTRILASICKHPQCH